MQGDIRLKIKREELEQLSSQTCDMARILYGNNLEEAQKTIGELVGNVNSTYLEYINNANQYKQAGLDIPVDILLSQMKNLLEAVDNRDILMLADTLQYEIYEGLMFFIDVERELYG